MPSFSYTGGSSGIGQYQVPLIWTWSGLLNTTENLWPNLHIVSDLALVQAIVMQKIAFQNLTFEIRRNVTPGANPPASEVVLGTFGASGHKQTVSLNPVTFSFLAGDSISIRPSGISGGSADTVTVQLVPQ